MKHKLLNQQEERHPVVPYIGTWIETEAEAKSILVTMVVPYIGTWIETQDDVTQTLLLRGRTLYRYVD